MPYAAASAALNHRSRSLSRVICSTRDSGVFAETPGW
jgi:hypothetical protein